MSIQQEIGFGVLEVATVASFGIPAIGPFLGAGLVAVNILLRAATSNDGKTRPAGSLDQAALVRSIDSIFKDTLARQQANNVAAAFFWYQREMDSLLWPEDEEDIPDVDDARLKKLSKDLDSFISGKTSLLDGIQNLEDPEFGAHFISGLVMGQSTHLQFLKLLIILDRHLKGNAPLDRINKMILLYKDYEKSLLQVKDKVDKVGLERLWKQAPNVGDVMLARPNPNFTAIRDQIVRESYQGNPNLVTTVVWDYRKQLRQWEAIKLSLKAN
jgi:hypothetical protein